MSKLISIKTYKHISDARKDKLLLEKNEIHCFITNENLVKTDAILSQILGGIQLQVFDVDINEAAKILANDPEVYNRFYYSFYLRWKRFELNIVCKRCGSDHIFRIEKLGGGFNTSWHILGIPIKISKNDYYCYKCDGDLPVKI